MRLGLFDHQQTLGVAGFAGARRLSLNATAHLEHVPAFLRGDAELFQQLREGLTWHEAKREMYERTVAVPRLLASVPEDGPGHPVLDEISAALSERYRRPVDRVSLALYRNGRDSVAYHGDRMGEQVADCVVAILSLRGPRRLRIRPKQGAEGALAFDLGYGDLLVMAGSCQRDYEHCVPKVADAPPRMSVMFRSSPLGRP
jgi:alkylated DNA repair dioxygenase AlkB